MNSEHPDSPVSDRRLGEEWSDWDGSVEEASTETDHRIFLGLAVVATVVIILASGLFLWLIYPRLTSAGEILPRIFSWAFLVFSGVLLAWLLTFSASVLLNRPFTRLVIIPQLVNRLLAIVLALGKMAGFSPDRLTNSFLKIHNLFLGSGPLRTSPDKLLLLLPRCLTKDNFDRLRELREKYQFLMTTVSGGNAARKKIRELHPKLIIAIACERDLISGFKEVNTHIPVIGFPNRRPEGPCKNTCVDLTQIEETIRKCLK